MAFSSASIHSKEWHNGSLIAEAPYSLPLIRWGSLEEREPFNQISARCIVSAALQTALGCVKARGVSSNKKDLP